MGLDDTDAVKAKGNCKSEKSKESDNKRIKKRNNGVNYSRDDEDDEAGEERAASGCWVKLRFMIGCVPSKSDVDASSSSLCETNTSTGN